MTLNVGGDLNSASGLKAVNDYLAARSYIDGYTPSQTDVALFDGIGKAPDAKQHPHVRRWWNHINSYSQDERKKWPGVKKSLSDFGASANGAAAAAPAKDDDDFDPFASDEDDEAAEKAREERVKAYQEKKSKKPALVAKSNVVLDVKVSADMGDHFECYLIDCSLCMQPWDDETDMKLLEEAVRKVQCDGLVWGVSKLVPLAYGIKKLQIVCVVEDEKVSIDWLQEEICTNEDLVQSVDIAAFQKI